MLLPTALCSTEMITLVAGLTRLGFVAPTGVVVKTKPGTVGQARCATLQSQWKFSSGGEAALLLVLARLPHLVAGAVSGFAAAFPRSPFLLGLWLGRCFGLRWSCLRG